MTRNGKAQGGMGALWASQNFKPGFYGRQAAAGRLTVDALGLLLAWYPAIAMCLGKLVTRIWPNFRRA